MSDNVKSLIDEDFNNYLNRHFDDYDGDSFKRLVARYPQLADNYLECLKRQLLLSER